MQAIWIPYGSFWDTSCRPRREGLLVLRLEGGNLLFEGELNQNNFSIEMKRQKWFKTNRNGQFFLQQHTETHKKKQLETDRN